MTGLRSDSKGHAKDRRLGGLETKNGLQRRAVHVRLHLRSYQLESNVLILCELSARAEMIHQGICVSGKRRKVL